MRQIRPRALAVGLAFVVIAQALVIVTGPGDPFVDDAWISLRYARNLVEGHGLVFNPGERVEGYTHPLWVLLDAIIVGLRLPPRTALSLLGVACWIAALFATRRAAREGGASVEAQTFAGAIVAFAAMGVFWGLSGLETAAFAWVLVEAVRLTCAAVRGQSRGVAAGLVFGLACLIRPEGALALVIVIVVTSVTATREKAGPRCGRGRASFWLASSRTLRGSSFASSITTLSCPTRSLPNQAEILGGCSNVARPTYSRPPPRDRSSRSRWRSPSRRARFENRRPSRRPP
jgi:hypothetical protein